MKQMFRMAYLCGALVFGGSLLAAEAKQPACAAQGKNCKANLESMAVGCRKTGCDRKGLACKQSCDKKGLDCKQGCDKKGQDCKQGCDRKGLDCKQSCDRKGQDCRQSCDRKGLDCKQSCDRKGQDCKQSCDRKGLDCKQSCDKKAVRPSHCPMGRWELDLASLNHVRNPERKPRKAIEMTLSKDGKINGYSGVNRFFGNVSLKKDGTIALDGMGSTRMMGMAMGYEDAFMQALAKVKFFQVHCGRLLLKDADKNVILQFNR